MRGEYYLLLCLLFIAATSLGVEEFSSGDSFSLEEDEYVVHSTSSQASVLELDDSRSIFYVDDCLFSAMRRACLLSTSNESVRIEFFVLEHALDVSAQVSSPVRIGDSYTYELLLENTGDLDAEVFVEISGVDSLSRLSGFDSLGRFSGVVLAGRSRTLSFESTASGLGSFEINASVSGDVNTSVSHVVEVVDELAVDVSYQDSVSVSVPYNFSIDVGGSDEVDVSVFVPDWISVDNQGSFSNDLFVSELANESPFWFTYSATDVRSGAFGVWVNDSAHSRYQEFSVSALASLPLVLSSEFVNSQIVIGEPTDIVVSVHNPNNESISASYDAVSVLVDESGSVEVSANNYSEIILSVLANRSGEYGIRVHTSFVDENNHEVLSQLFIPFVARPAALSSQVVISGPSSIVANESANLSVSVDDDFFVEWSFNSSVIANGSWVVVDVPGTYTVSVRRGSQSYTATHTVVLLAQEEEEEVVVDSEQEEVVEEEDEVVSSSSAASWYLFVAVVLVLVVGGLLVFRIRSTIIESEYQQQLLEVLSMEVSSPEEASLRDDLLEELLHKNKKER